MIYVKNESGRSLVEMLAVVSIMGVLIVGAMSALQFGTTSMQVTSAYSQIERIAAGVIDLYSWNRNYPSGEGAAQSIAKKIQASGDVCEECTYDDGEAKVELPWGTNGQNEMVITAGDESHFEIRLPDVPKDVCLRLKNMQWNYAQWDEDEDCSETTKVGRREYVEGITLNVY